MSKDPTTPPDDEAVGYGRPPRHTRFKPGQSGNPRGRPKQSGTVKVDMDALLYAPVAVTRDGGSQTMSRLEVTYRRILAKALKGDTRSIAHMLKAFEKHDIIELPKVQQGGVVNLPNDLPPRLASTLLEHYGRPPWTKRQIARFRPEYEKTRDEREREYDMRWFGR